MASLTTRPRAGVRLGSERGAEIIELILVTPVNAAREGARIGVLPSYACDDTTSDVEDRVEAYLQGSGIPNTSTYTIDMEVLPIATASGTFDACVVSVELTQPLPSLSVIGALTGGAFGNVPVRARAVMRTETQASPAPAP
jgi:hypothetical protein